jgi:hypothetical protein
MPLKKSLLILCVFLSFSNANAQKYELGKVTIAELQEKEYPKDPSAVAAVLFKRGEVSSEYSQIEGFVMYTKVQTRIKIYKKEGYKFANQEVSYYLGNKINESVSFSDAVTYNFVDGKVEKTKLKSDGQFDQNINKYIGQKKISMPNVKEGSVIEFEYIIKSPNIGSLKEWSFQTSIPVNYSEYKTIIPEYFVYKTNQKGFIFPKVTAENNTKLVSIKSKERAKGIGGVATNIDQDELTYQETKTTYIAENLPAMKEEAYVNNIDNYTSSISNELNMIKFPNEAIKPYSTDWEAVAKTIYNMEDFGTELNKTGYFEESITTLIVGLKTRDEIVSAIFNYVKSSVNWNNYYGYSCNDGVIKAYKDKVGNVAEINLMLTAMLRFAGITANPVLVSTRSNGIAMFPSRTAFNYVIVAVETPEGHILLDATEKYSLPNVLPLRDLNWFGRLIRKDGTSTEVDLMPKNLSRETSTIYLVMKSDGTVDGKIRSQYTDHIALEFRRKNLATSKDTYLEELENKNNSIEISDYVRANELDLSKPIMETYSFKSNKDVEIINGKIYISPMLFLTAKENPFKQEIREYPVDFGNPFESKIYINLEIPEGYAIESLPKAMNSLTGDSIGAFSYVIENVGNKIQLIVSTNINTAIVSADFYDVIKEFYQKRIDKQNEKIVLKKI